MPRKKREKPVEEMQDRELAEHVLGKELVERLHADFDLRDTNAKQDDDLT
jgi:hypothetical protein